MRQKAQLQINYKLLSKEKGIKTARFLRKRAVLARHEELESPTFGSVDQRSIQLS